MYAGCVCERSNANGHSIHLDSLQHYGYSPLYTPLHSLLSEHG